MGLEKTQHIGRIIVHPTNPDIVWVSALGAAWASNPERGLYKTTDGGRTWALSKFISDKAGFIDIAMDPRNPNVLFASSYERVRGPHFLKSGGPGSALVAHGRRRHHVAEVKGGGFPETTKGRISIVIAPSNPNIVYTMVEADSVRGEKPQRLLQRRLSLGGRREHLALDERRPTTARSTSRRFASTRRTRIASTAWRWTSRSRTTAATRGAPACSASTRTTTRCGSTRTIPNHFIVGGDAGLFQTHDKGGTYDGLNNFAMGQFYGISYDFQVPYRVCGGLQDNGTSCGIEPAPQRPAPDDRLVRDLRRRRPADARRTR